MDENLKDRNVGELVKGFEQRRTTDQPLNDQIPEGSVKAKAGQIERRLQIYSKRSVAPKVKPQNSKPAFSSKYKPASVPAGAKWASSDRSQVMVERSSSVKQRIKQFENWLTQKQSDQFAPLSTVDGQKPAHQSTNPSANQDSNPSVPQTSTGMVNSIKTSAISQSSKSSTSPPSTSNETTSQSKPQAQPAKPQTQGPKTINIEVKPGSSTEASNSNYTPNGQQQQVRYNE